MHDVGIDRNRDGCVVAIRGVAQVAHAVGQLVSSRRGHRHIDRAVTDVERNTGIRGRRLRNRDIGSGRANAGHPIVGANIRNPTPLAGEATCPESS